MRNFLRTHRADLLRSDLDDMGCRSIKGHELHFIADPAIVDKDHRAYVACLQAIFLDGPGEDHPLMLANHVGTLIQGMGRDQPRNRRLVSYHPNCSDPGFAPVRTSKGGIHREFSAESSYGTANRPAFPGLIPERGRQGFQVVPPEPPGEEEPRF